MQPADWRSSSTSSRPCSSAERLAGVAVDWETGRHEVPDIEIRQLLKRFLEFTRAQVLQEKELEAKCLQLEMEECGLWHQILSTDHTSNRSRISILEPECEEIDLVSPHRSIDPSFDVLGEASDEFEDAWVSSNSNCAYAGGWPQQHSYLYAEPGGSGNCFPVAEVQDLFRIVSEEGVCSFYNDSEEFIMKVRLTFSPSPEIAPGPKTIVTEQYIKRNLTMYEVLVHPEETEILLFGDLTSFNNVTERIPVTSSFVNAHVQRIDDMRHGELDRLVARTATKQHVSAEDALRMCDPLHQVFFIDPEFPPVYSSLHRGEDLTYLWAVPWRRPEEYLPPKCAEEVRLFCGEIRPQDPQSGEGWTEYLCSAARLLAMGPKDVQSLFRHPVSPAAGKEERRKHAYRVTLNLDGWWQTTLVDSFLPASRKGPTFGRCEYDLRKLWYPLVEKAYAKMSGSYAAIQHGSALEAYQALTGCPVSSFDTEWENWKSRGGGQQQFEGLFRRFERELQVGNTVVLSTPTSGPKSWRGFSMGLKWGTSCAVRHVVRHEGFRLLQICSPVLTPGRWDGRWCAESIVWEDEPEVTAKCHLFQMYDCIWLEWDEVFSVFCGGGVCYTSVFPAVDYRVKGVFSAAQTSACLLVRVPQSVKVYFLLTQPTPRLKSDAAISPLSLSVGKIAGANLVPYLYNSRDPDAPMKDGNVTKDQKLTTAKSVAVRCLLEPGITYAVVPHTSSTEEMPYTIALLHQASECTTCTVHASFFRLGNDSKPPLSSESVRLTDTQLNGDTTAEWQKRTKGVVTVSRSLSLSE